MSSILSRLYRRIYTLAIWIGFMYCSYQDTLTFNHHKGWSQKKLGERFKTPACHTHKSIIPHLLLSGSDSIASIMRLRWNSKTVVNKSLHPKCFIFRMQWSWQQKDLLPVNHWQVLSHFKIIKYVRFWQVHLPPQIVFYKILHICHTFYQLFFFLNHFACIKEWIWAFSK